MSDPKRRSDDKVIDIVLSEVRENRGEIRKLADDVATLKVKSGVWGFIAGAIPVSMAGIWIWVKSTMRG